MPRGTVEVALSIERVEESEEPVLRTIDAVSVELLVVVLAKGASVLLAKGATSMAFEAVARSPTAKRAAEIKEGIMIKDYGRLWPSSERTLQA